ncbi:MAG TPA: glycosyltransferase family 2 protein [Salinimicrobium sp.]|nr:glycosyltransferase family 2 protein [Salinimicrobium sp.]
MPQLSTAVVILNWNGKNLLEQFLPSVISFSKEAAIYVADNASTDDSVSFIAENFPQVKIIQNKTNGGYAKGYNDALRNLEEDIFILLNSDVEVTENWLSPILSIFENEKETAVVQPKILDFKNREYFEYAGAAGGFLDKYGYPFCRGRIFDILEKDEGQYDDETEIFWASGACFAIRRNIFNEVGGFDEDYFAHQEEIDLCWRIHNKGHKLKYTGFSKIYHVGGATLNNVSPQKTFLNFRNSLFSILKNVPIPQVWWIIFCRLLLDGLAGVKFLLEGKFKHTWAIIEAHFSFYGNLLKMYEKRDHLHKKHDYFRIHSLVTFYFIRKKSYYQDIK